MNEQLRNRLAEIAEDAPSAGLVLQTVRIGSQRRLHRRRWAAATAAAVAVIIATVGVTTVLRPSADGTASVPAPVGVTTTSTATANSTPGTQVVGERAVPSLPLAADSKLVPFAGATVTSPVSVPASWVAFDPDGPDVMMGPAFFQATWNGQAPTAMETLDVVKGTTGTGQVRGYLVTTAAPALDVYAPGGNITSTSESISVNGHAAQLLTAPKGSFENTYATPAAARVTWQLPDRRWIQVWAVSEARSALVGFASSITDVPTVYPSNISPGLTLGGLTSATVADSSFVSQMGGPGITLCKPGAAEDPLHEQCLRIWSDVDDGSMAQGVVMGAESDAQFQAETTTALVGDLRVQVNTKWQVSWARWGAATIQVTAPTKAGLTSADLAALAAAVRLAPTLSVRNEPNPIVESSLADEASQAAATATG